MRTGLSNFIESVQTRTKHKLGCSTDQDAIQTWNQPKTGASTMSKNQCTTCKHYKPVHATNPRGDCTLYPVWVDVWAAHYCGQWSAEEAPTSELDIDWSQVPEGYDWAAQDEDGYVYGHPDKPTPHENIVDGFWRWQVPESKQCYVDHRTLLTNWRNTLTRRPSTN